MTNNKKNTQGFIFIFIFALAISLIVCPVVLAENETNNETSAGYTTEVNSSGDVSETIPEGKLKITLSLPSSLADQKMTITDEKGESLGTITIDSRGQGSAIISSKQSISVSVGSDSPSPNETSKNSTSWSILDIIGFSIIAAAVSGFIFYTIGKKKIMKKFEPALDVIFNEEIDDV